MNHWNADHFAVFFEAVHGYAPFPWQRALVERALARADAPWPEAIALPTASGKTACIDIAVFALAAQPEVSPRRIYFIVDRRVIVDEAYRRAKKLAQALNQAKNGVVLEVAEALRQIAGQREGEENEADPLAVFQLRGGIYRDEQWAKTPLQPTVICSTVDQLGSRLLYRGYGRSAKAWPIHAGLVGNDSLFILDEAHCAQPFLETLHAVGKFRAWAESPLPAPFRVVVMSATPPACLKDILGDSAKDRAHPVLGKRLDALKPTKLALEEKAKGKNWTPPLVERLAKEALALLGDGRQAIGIMVNRVATAKAVFDTLQKHDVETALFTGRMRPLDRDAITRDYLKKLDAADTGSRFFDNPLFVVATQTLEVGANLDFDGLVTECASLDALRQRFGRLNRAGRDIAARAVIVVRADQAEDSSDDPVYGPALAATWKWLCETSQGGEIDFSVTAFSRLLPSDDEKRMELLAFTNAPTAHAPVLLPSHVDMLAQTAPVPQPSPDVALLLHGPRPGVPDVQVCWRADLTYLPSADPSEDEQDNWLDALVLCPPATAECAPVPLFQLKRWLAGDASLPDYADVEGGNADTDPSSGQKEKRWVVRWRGRDDSKATDEPRDIRPGDVVVIPAQCRGWETLAQLPPDGEQPQWLDVAEGAYLQARGRAVLRLHPGVLGQWPEGAARQALLDIAAITPEDRQALEDADLEDRLKTALRSALDKPAPALPAWLIKTLEALAEEKSLVKQLAEHPHGGWIVRGRRRIDPGAEGLAFTDEDDASASGTVRVTLRKHSEGVAGFARRFAEGAGLAQEMVEDLALAGLCHDLGKADPRFQALLNGGNRWAVAGEPLAKSANIPQGLKAFRRALKLSGYPKGGRHELLSVRLLESAPELLAKAHDPDLVLHLIASHHGHCRPFAPVVRDEDPRPVPVRFAQLGEFTALQFGNSSETGLERLDSGVAERFWRLVRRYGWWGLAWLEAILRLADHRRSEWETTKEAENE